MTAITNKDAVIQSNLARIGFLEERVAKLYADYDSVIGMVQDLVEVVNGDGDILADVGARLKDLLVAVDDDIEVRLANLEDAALPDES